MKLSEMPYTRPNVEEFEQVFSSLLDNMKEAGTPAAQMQEIDAINALRADFDTNCQLASIRYTQDTTSEFNKKEKEFFDQNSPLYENLQEQFYRALIESPFRTELEAHYGQQLFDIAGQLIKVVSPDVLEDCAEENKLTSEYAKLMASASIPFEGEDRNLMEMVPFYGHADRDVRERAVKANAKFFEENAEAFDGIFDQLVKLRHGMAKKLGFKNYVEMGYARLMRTDYGSEEVAFYRQQVLEHVVPLASKLKEKQRERLNLDRLYFHDEKFEFKSGNPKPQGDPDWIEARAGEMYKELSEETDTFYQFMLENELMDNINRKGKYGGGYCNYLINTRSPFIFSNFNGTAHDVTVLTHEAGHAFQVFNSRDFDIPEYNWPTYEACEIHSMGMEFLTWPWMNKFFEQDTEKFFFKHMAGAITFLPYGVAVDEFQHLVYENPDATPEERHGFWKSVEEKYLPHRKYSDGNDFLDAGGFWQRQAHIYQDPFYYIDYTLAQICAFQLWFKSEENREQTWNDYLTLCKAGGSKSFLKLVELAGLKSPFAEGCLKEVTERVEAWLDEFDASKLN